MKRSKVQKRTLFLQIVECHSLPHLTQVPIKPDNNMPSFSANCRMSFFASPDTSAAGKTRLEYAKGVALHF